jgi:competence protein ComEC
MFKIKKIIFYFYLLIVISLVFLAGLTFFYFKPFNFYFIAFNVGQGDSFLIKTPDHLNILIDGGPDDVVIYKLGQYLPFYDRTIDLMILSHPHADHLVGLIEVIKRYEVRKIWLTGVKTNTVENNIFFQIIKEKGIPVEVVNQTGTVALGRYAKMEIVYPDRSFWRQDLKNLNDSSIVAKILYGQSSILLMGDFDQEEKLVKTGIDLKSDILKIGHHGAKLANDLTFLEAVKPDYAIISLAATNKYGHPNPETIERLQLLETKILRTDQSGDIVFFSAGAKIWLK